MSDMQKLTKITILKHLQEKHKYCTLSIELNALIEVNIGAFSYKQVIGYKIPQPLPTKKSMPKPNPKTFSKVLSNHSCFSYIQVFQFG